MNILRLNSYKTMNHSVRFSNVFQKAKHFVYHVCCQRTNIPYLSVS